MKVALVHDSLTAMRGAERVAKVLTEIWPDAPLYTFVYNKENLPEFSGVDVRPSSLNRFKIVRKHYKFFLLLRAFYFGLKTIKNADLILSSSSAEAKYIKAPKGVPHISYCHTPTRYYWTDYKENLKNAPFGIFNPLARLFLFLFIGLLRRIDYNKAQKVDYYIANSEFVRGLIKKYYNRDAEVIYPPVDTKRFSISSEVGDYFLVLGAQAWYKKTDIVIESFNKLGLPLRIIGDGPAIGSFKAIANSNIRFLGRLSDEESAKQLSHAIALIHPQVEDFGIVILESNASGRPVIAFKGGGAVESVKEGVSGEFFTEQTAESLMKAVQAFDKAKYNPSAIRDYALQFDQEVFKSKIKNYVEQKYSEFIAGAVK